MRHTVAEPYSVVPNTCTTSNGTHSTNNLTALPTKAPPCTTRYRNDMRTDCSISATKNIGDVQDLADHRFLPTYDARMGCTLPPLLLLGHSFAPGTDK